MSGDGSWPVAGMLGERALPPAFDHVPIRTGSDLIPRRKFE